PTYRHVLSSASMTVLTIAHCDIDAAYAQFEQVRLGLPDDIPLICAQWQSIIAVNYPARKYGIKRFNTIDEAKKMCPHLVVQHVATYRNGEAEAGYWGEVDPRTHKVSLDPYRRESLKILAIFKEMVPRGEIEKASIDEAFLDLTTQVLERLLERFPYLSQVPPDAPEGLDSALPTAPPVNWQNSGNVFPIDGETDPALGIEEPDGSQEPEGKWEDWALCIGAEIMSELRAEVYKRLHYTCSAGIAHNKAMAKLCSAWKKPNNQTVLRIAATPAFLRNMDFTDIRFLGGKLGNAIATEYGAKTVGDMLTVPLDELQRRFGEESVWVYNIIRGIDHTEVKERVTTKSMLASKNTRPAVTTPAQGLHWIQVLSGELNVRLREAREVSPGLWPKTLVLSHRTGGEASRSRQTPFPFTRDLSTEYIVKYASKLWAEVCQPMEHGSMKVNNMALAFNGLEKLEDGQKGIEGFFSNPSNLKRPHERLRSKSPHPPSEEAQTSTSTPPPKGESPMKKPRLPTLHTGKEKRKTVLETFLRNSTNSPSLSEVTKVDADPPDVVSDIVVGTAEQEDAETWSCPRCKERFTLSRFGSMEGEDVVDVEERNKRMREVQQEHEDYHFAKDLQEGVEPRRAPVAQVKRKAEGIKAFFRPR
ncbi:hypothetical protein TREMEDRAFT_12962, partial [Tremella mesenterica DSM 1558]|uniref:uncharacterized protein n=1 Tax=Tremella mesenterica (strain ATCC 24925 / CBS 8224 / DSM 1558 / NBRC 9311 / NRRL Y-6157 / RJB 2259-6 / UBC 559-6) TaxID=578456 RepID=UPI0003F4A52F